MTIEHAYPLDVFYIDKDKMKEASDRIAKMEEIIFLLII